MRSCLALAALLLLTACHKGDPAGDQAGDAGASSAPASSAPSQATPSTLPSMIAPVGTPPRETARVTAVPDEITRLRDRIANCEHFAGEEPYDPDRAAFLRQQVAATCPGNAAELQRLRKKYAANPGLAKQLSTLEAIEM